MFVASNSKVYGYVSEDMESEESKIVCPISLSTSKDSNNVFDWLIVPLGKCLFHSYMLEEFKEYCDSFEGEIPDPQRTLPRLNHMQTRMLRQLALPSDIRLLKNIDVTDEYRRSALQEVLNAWQNKTDLSDTTKAKSLIINLKTFDDMNLIFKNMDRITVESILKPMNMSSKGVFALRSSSLSKEHNDGDYTILTMTYTTAENKFNNIRHLVLHGVGVYCLTAGLNILNIPNNVLQSGDIQKY